MKIQKTLNRIGITITSIFLILSFFSCENTSDDTDNDCDGIECEKQIVNGNVKDDDCDGLDNDCDGIANPDKDDDEVDNAITKAAAPYIGQVDADWEKPAIRGTVYIQNCGPTFIDCNWVPCDPVIISGDCSLPNGFCQQIFVAGSFTGSTSGNGDGLQTIELNDGNSVQTVIKPLPAKEAVGAVLKINLPGGIISDTESIIDRLKRNKIEIPKNTTITEVAKKIANNFYIPEGSMLSENLIAQIQKANPENKIESISVVGGDYKITRSEKQPNGSIYVAINVKRIDKSTPLLR